MRNLPSSVTLRPVDDTNRDEIVDGVAASLSEAAASPGARRLFRAIYAGDRPVGF